MADRTVRAIFEAVVTKARKGMTDLGSDVDKAGKKVDALSKDLKGLDAQKVKPDVDVEIDKAKSKLSDLTRELGDLKKEPSSLAVDFKIEQAKAAIKDVRGLIKDLTGQKAEVRIEAGISDAKKNIDTITRELGELRTLEVTPQVTADIKDAQRRMREAKASLRDLNGAKASLKVTADTSSAEGAVKGLKGDIADAGAEGGADAGEGLAKGIISALGTIPIAGAVVGIGAAIGIALIAGIKDGLQVEAQRDLFSARTGLDEATAARFGRAAGEAYANAYGESIEGNLDAARRALAGGLIDSKATDAEIENVIAKLTGLQDLFEYDIPMSVSAVGNALKTGLVKDADQAFDLITAASQKLPSDDLIETVNEYANQFVLMGLTGEQAFGLIVQGAQAGARDTDKVADSLKELGLRVREGTDPAVEALKTLGLNTKDTIKAFQEGGPKATTAIGTIFDALRKLDAKGGNTQAVIASLFGGPGEDLGAALFALDLDSVSSALGGVNGSAGAAERALATMSDNSASKIESAERNIEVAADGIKGALAEAFSDDISGAADWVSKNRAPLLEFFVDVMDGTFEMGRTFLEFSATAQEAIADVIVGIADLLDSLPGDQSELKKSMYGIADGLREGASTIREDFIPAIDEAKTRADNWAAPEILKAKLHDATVQMAEDMDGFSAKVAASGGTVKINGDKLNAEEVLRELTDNINASDGTVLIEGNKVPAEDALDEVLRQVRAGRADIEVGAQTSPAEVSVKEAKGRISRSEAALTVTADLTPAERELATFRAHLRKLGIRVSGVTSVGGAHDGGWTGRVAPGLYAGGRVPGSDPGYDNILWPLNSGGHTLAQPLAGGEFVVNSKDAAFWAPVLELMNAGARPSSGGSHTEHNSRTVIHNGDIVANDPGAYERDIANANLVGF